MLATQSDSVIRHDLIEQLADARQHTDELFALVKPDSLYERPIAERHRIIFYIGHLEAFDWNLFHERVLGLKSFHPEFDRLFAFGIDPVGGGLPADQPADWPAIAAVREYVEKTRAVLDKKLADALADSQLPASDGFPLSTLLNVAIEHRLMHAETLAYMLHQLPLDRKVRQRGIPPERYFARSITEALRFPPGRLRSALRATASIFGWDNEYRSSRRRRPGICHRSVQSDEPAVSRIHRRRRLRNSRVLGRRLKVTTTGSGSRSREFRIPAFWKREQGRPMALSHHVRRYAVAAGLACLRESGGGESLCALGREVAAHRSRVAACGLWHSGGRERTYPWGERSPGEVGNFDFARWSPVAGECFSRRARVPLALTACWGMGGSGPPPNSPRFPAFEPFPFYRGYSADFFDGKHFVMKGGSARTAACMLRPTFRNWFQPHYQFVYTGFRCVSR